MSDCYREHCKWSPLPFCIQNFDNYSNRTYTTPNKIAHWSNKITAWEIESSVRRSLGSFIGTEDCCIWRTVSIQDRNTCSVEKQANHHNVDKNFSITTHHWGHHKLHHETVQSTMYSDTYYSRNYWHNRRVPISNSCACGAVHLLQKL